ncbi:hypothetical protein BLS_001909 [Venturia inaequalis]|uniref:Uncharacterized protein n=1 Tax=Venturia inaequalis TaxID=5025 RepID=A0A8H3Z4V5_VENIN|nr:hypothetical protein EG328_004879 [Venturia inaequalis]KAE9976702.1 hypothetical protein BLS_001909 [Venturia inaequalis]KAE9979796.1 hypothetical protein EG327_006889 [Venturia inaequalis]RDI88382.1 Uncharacterized protein Vi05172_g976 [Venturia inaequalis]
MIPPKPHKPTIPKFLGVELPTELRQSILIRTYTVPPPDLRYTTVPPLIPMMGGQWRRMEIGTHLTALLLMRKLEMGKIMVWADRLKEVFPGFGGDVDYVEERWQRELKGLYEGPETALREAMVVG